MDLICFVHRYCASNRGDCYGFNVHTKILKNFSILRHSYLNLTENSFMMQCTAVLCYQYIQITWCMYWLTLLQSKLLRYAFQHSFTCTIFFKDVSSSVLSFFIIHVSSSYFYYSSTVLN